MDLCSFKPAQLRIKGLQILTSSTCLLLAIALLLNGCAPSTRMVKEMPEPERLEPQVASVNRYQDGRVGFLINEPVRLSDELNLVFVRGAEALQQKRYEDALEDFERVLAESPELSAAHINMATAYAGIGRVELAEDHLQTALEIIPGHPLAGHAYGLLLRKDGRFDEARVLYQQVLGVFPEYYPVRRNYGILCDLYLNDPECALDQFASYSEAAPDDEQVKLWISELNLRLGR